MLSFNLLGEYLLHVAYVSSNVRILIHKFQILQELELILYGRDLVVPNVLRRNLPMLSTIVLIELGVCSIVDNTGSYPYRPALRFLNYLIRYVGCRVDVKGR